MKYANDKEHKMMNYCLRALFALALFTSVNCHALSIQFVNHSPVKSVYKFGEPIFINFYLDEAAKVKLKIYDDREYLIRTVSSASNLEQGDHILTWDGKDYLGDNVPYEVYHYTLEANNGADNVVYDVTDQTGNDKGVLQDINWDKKFGTISYFLRKASRVNIRAGIGNGGPLLETIINWQPRSAGKHVEQWSGYDKSKQIDISEIENAQIYGEGYSLSKNSLLIGEETKPSQYVAIDEPLSRSRKQNRKYNDNKGLVAQDRVDYQMNIKLPDGKVINNNKTLYKGVVPVKISLPKKDLMRLHADRFETILFVDGKYVSELETGFFPLTWKLKTKDYKNGKHYLTVNLRGYAGQYGAMTKTFFVEN